MTKYIIGMEKIGTYPNGPETVGRFDVTLERNAHDAVMEAVTKLNAGTTGAIRTQRKKKGKK